MQFFANMDFEIRLRVKNRESQNSDFALDFISNDEGVDPMILRRNPDTLLNYPKDAGEEQKQRQHEEQLKRVHELLTGFLGKNGKKPNHTQFRGIIRDELGVSDSAARKIIKNGKNKFWKEPSAGNGKPTFYHPAAGNEHE